MTGNLKVLSIPNVYPNNVNPFDGVYVHNQLNRLSDCGVELIVVSPIAWSPGFLSLLNRKWKKLSDVDKEALFGRVRVKYPRYIRLPGLWFYPYSGVTCYLGIRKTVENLYQQFPFDVIYANGLIPSGYAGCLLSNKLNLPSVCYVGENDLGYLNFSNYSNRRMKYVISNSARLIAVSKHQSDRILEIANPKEPIEVIYRGTDINLFKPVEKRFELKHKLSLPEECQVIAFLGRLAKTKGVYDLLNAFSLLAPKLPHAYLLIMGYGPEKGNLEALSKELGFSKRIIFSGPIRNEEIPSYFSITDVMALPSYSEGLPNAVVEAIACGVPVVATNVGGIPEIVSPGVNGFLVEKGDFQALSSSLIRILKDEALRKSMRIQSRKIAEYRFNAKENAEKLKNFLSQVVEGHSSKYKDN